MPRVGQNPMKSVSRAFVPAELSVCTMVYIPSLKDYWEHSFDTLKVCLNSILKNTSVPFDLIVLDNGSCAEVREFLIRENQRGNIRVLLLSHQNLGKPAGWNVLFPACPGKYLAFTDSDCLFYPGWAEACLQIFQTHQNVGLVTARPSRAHVEQVNDYFSTTLNYAANTPGVQLRTGDLIAPAILEEHARSCNHALTAESYQHPFEDFQVSKDGLTSYISAGPWQFMTPRSVALQMLPIGVETALGSEKKDWDFKINSAGFLKFAPAQAYVRHLGNQLDAEEIQLLAQQGLLSDELVQPANVATGAPQPGLAVRILRKAMRYGRIRWLLHKLYIALFQAFE